MSRYIYEGPVTEFGAIVAFHWKSETVATSESKARCNLKYQYKVQHNKKPGVRIDLPGKISKID